MYNRILKRPMFKMGGRSYSAQGTGITSGLDTPKRGLVDSPGGYAGRTLEEIETEKIKLTEPRMSETDRIIKSFGVYASPYKADGTAKTSGEMGYEQAVGITEERDEQKNLEDLAALSNLEAEEAQIRKDLDRDADQADAIEKIKAEAAAKKFEIEIELKQVDNYYAGTLLELETRLKSATTEADKKIVEDAIKQVKRKIAQEKKDIATRKQPGKTMKEQIIELAVSIYEAESKKPGGGSTTIEDAMETAKKIITGKAKGGRVGYNIGTGMDGAQPMEASMNIEETISKPNETITEDISMTDTAGKVPTINMPYAEFREKLPAEISDDIAELLYYNQDAFNDFAEINDQSQVYEFNNKYQVNLVLPMNTEMV
jgi:hypothetical protein